MQDLDPQNSFNRFIFTLHSELPTLILLKVDILDTTFAIILAKDFDFDSKECSISGESKKTRVLKIEPIKNLISELGCNTGFRVKVSKYYIEIESGPPPEQDIWDEKFKAIVSLENSCDIYTLK